MDILGGVTVLEISTGASAPYCGRVLADWGARVIKLEKPGGDVSREWDDICNGLSAAFVWLNRNKESIVLDLSGEEGRQALARLMSRVDVVLHNQMTDTAERLGFSYAAAASIRPDIIHCQISGYGTKGEFANTKTYDLLMQGEAGILAMTGTPEAMAKIPLSICDLATGLFAAAAIEGALMHRSRTGIGAEIGVPMFGVMMDWLGYFPYLYWNRGEVPKRAGDKHHLLTPYGPYRTRDDSYVNLAALSQQHWVRFCRDVLLEPALLQDPRYVTNEARRQHRTALEGHIAVAVLKEDAAVWERRLSRADIPWGHVNRLDQALAHPALVASRQVRRVPTARGPVQTLDNPITWSTGENRLDGVPELGEHTSSVLRELGYGSDEVEGLVAGSAPSST